MKVKKALSLILALVMVFTLVPAQLIFSSANYSHYTTGDIGAATKFVTDVTLEKGGDYDGLVKVALKIAVDNDQMGYDKSYVTAFQNVLKVDATKLSPVSSAKSTRGQATLADIIAGPANQAPAYKVSRKDAGAKFALFNSPVPTLAYDEDEEEYVEGSPASFSVNDLSALSYNATSNNLYVCFAGLAPDITAGALLNTTEPTVIIYTYLKMLDGTALSDVPGAISLVTEEEIRSDSTGCLSPNIISENQMATTKTAAAFVTDNTVNFSDDFTPAAETCTITFTGIKKADGTAADDVVLTPEIGTEVTAPTLSDYSTSEFDYAAAGWDKDVVSPATGDATYTAQYTKKAVDKSALQSKIAEAQAKNEEAYTPASWTEADLANSIAAATAVLNNADASKTDVAAAVSALETALGKLVEKPDTYTIKFHYEDGSEVAADVVLESGESVIFPTPTKENTAEFTYTFDGWYLGETKVDDTTAVTATADATYVAKYNATKNKYTVTFKNGDDDSVISTQEIEYGSTPTYPTVNNYEDDLNTYTFTGWDKALEPVIGPDVVYTAQITKTAKPADYTAVDEAIAAANEIINSDEYAAKYTDAAKQALNDAIGAVDRTLTKAQQATVDAMAAAIVQAKEAMNLPASIKDYTITWLQDDETTIDTTTVKYGETPTHTDAAKNEDAQYTYTFSGWTPEISAVTGDATYKATYTTTTKEYEIKFVNWNGDVLQKSNVAYGAVPTYTGTNPSRAADTENTYEFSGWSPEVVAVTGEKTYTAQFTATPIVPGVTYTITFKNFDGTVLDTQTVDAGVTPVYSGTSQPTKAEDAQYTYTFSGWTPEIVPAAGDAIYIATYTNNLKSYTVTFKNGDDVLQTGSVAYGTVPSYSGTTVPEKASTAEFDYTFAGWEPEIKAVEGDAVYSAKFTATKRNYEVKFVNYDGAVLQSSNVEYGIVPAYSGTAVPEKPSTAQYNYSFAGWDTQPVAVTGPATYTATYNSELRSYMVTFKNGDTNLYHSMFNYGEIPVYNGEAPVKDEDNTYTYTFAGWEPELAAVDGEAVYQAKFTPVYKDYTITFVDYDNSVIATQTYHYGDEITPPENPERASDNVYTYDFDAWTPAVPDTVTENATFKATYEATYIDYVISFYDGDGNEIDVQQLHFGDPIVPPATANKTEDETYTYTFTGWNPQVPATVSEGEIGVYVATFEPVYKNYTVKFTVDGADYDVQTLHYGDAIVVPTDPSKDATAEYTYTFAGWSPAVAATVTGDAEYAATFIAEKNRYDVTVVTKDTEGNDLTATTSVEYGETPVLPEPATNFVVGTTKYTFTGWDKTVAPVTGPVTYTALYETSTVTNPVYTINFKFAETAEQAESKQFADHTQSIEQNDMPNVPTPANFETATMKYEFSGWDKDVVAATGDAVYTAQYTETPILQNFEINFRYADSVAQVEDGELADHIQVVTKGNMPEIPTPADFVDGNTTYTFVGWDKDVVAATGDAVYTAVYQAETPVILDYSKFEALVERYEQMVLTGLYNKKDLKAVKEFIDEIYDMIENGEFTSQDEVDAVTYELKVVEDSVRRIEKHETKEEEETTTRRTSRRTSPATGDNATLVVMSVILVSSIGLAVISLKKKRENI